MKTSRIHSSRLRHRKGATVVEFAMTAPLLFLVFFAQLEFSRANMLRHSVHTAAYEGARRGIVPGATVDDVRESAQSIINSASAINAVVDVDPEVITPLTETITVTVSIPLDDNAWVIPVFFSGRTPTSTCVLAREQLDSF